MNDHRLFLRFEKHVRWHENAEISGYLSVIGWLKEYSQFDTLVIESHIRPLGLYPYDSKPLQARLVEISPDSGIDPDEYIAELALEWLGEFKKLPEEKPNNE